MTAADNYFIKHEYRARTTIETVDEVSDGTYWNETRVRNALLYQFPVYQHALKLIRRRGLQTIADVGCGVARKLAYVRAKEPGRRYVGIDQPNAISYCRGHHEFGEWLADDFENPTGVADDLRADLVICCDVIEHLLDPNRLLSYLRRLTASDGFLLLSTPDRDAMRGTDCVESPNAFHVREWNPTEFATYLETAGLRIEEHFNSFASRVGFNHIFMKQARKRFPRTLRYNQIVVARFED